MIELGGNIQLVGFKELDPASMIVVKKIVGNYAKKMSEMQGSFEKLIIAVKNPARVFQVNSRLLADGKVFPSEAENHNLFMALDDSLKKIINSIT